MNKVLIVDDNKVIRLMLSEMLKKIEDIEVVGECETAIEAKSFLSKHEVDILLLDVEMPGMTGLELLKLLPEKPATILITAKTGYAIEAFELNVIDYLVKPVSIARVMLAIEKAKELLAVKNTQLNEINREQIFIKDNKVIRKILLNEILWLESKGDYVKINTAEKQYIIHSTLKNMEDKLPAAEFVRIHRGFLIPVSKIDYIEDGVAFIMGSAVPVSETYKNDLLKKTPAYLAAQMKNRIGYNFWILSLTIVLLLLILAAQLFTINNIRGLKTGNQEAAVIFTINNRLQEIVNTAALLETRVLENQDKNNMQAITDSLAAMGYNVSVLEKLDVDIGTRNNFIELNKFISRQVAISFKIMEATTSGNKTLRYLYADSLTSFNSGDSIYQTAINIEKGLEAKLKNTFNNNTEASQKLSTLNKIFALIAIAAILILGTIIINRHRHQVSLIKALEKANDEVKKSAMIKEQFLANMSHEIRTPLNAIKGFSRLLQQTALDKEQQKFSDIIEDSSNNLLNLVNDILDIAKIEAGKMTVEQKEFDLKRLMQTLESMFLNAAREKQLDFNWQIEEGVPQFLQGDPDRIYQILVNLVSNAIKCTKEGFVKVSVSKSLENEKEIALQFKVEDSGVGIPLKKQELIFERFQQAGNSEENIQKGTGLGLAIVKNMAALLGGSISVKSIEGEGSLFTVQLPFTKNIAEGNPVTSLDAIENSAVTFSGANVLVAEDNNVNRLLIAKLLKQYGIDPIIKENGMEVLEIMKEQHFDLLLLDIQMPLLDGYKTCVGIREAGNDLPVVAMTAYVMDAEKEKCIAAGMDGYLSKPLDEVQLKNILLKYLVEFAKYTKPDIKKNANSFLLQLAGGDEKMAEIILGQVKQELPVEIEKLKKIVSEKNMEALPAACHYLISSISPLGNNSSAMQKIAALQKNILEEEDEKEIIKNTEELITELENIYNNFKHH